MWGIELIIDKFDFFDKFKLLLIKITISSVNYKANGASLGDSPRVII